MATTSNQTTDPSISNFISIFEAAAKQYKELTKKDLHTHPFAAQFDTCDSPGDVLDLFRNQAQAFDEFRRGDDSLITWLDPTVNILLTCSATIGEGLALVPFSPAKMIFAGIGLLLTTAKDVVASHDTLVNLFERIQYFLQRLNIYNGIPLTTDMTALFGKIMAHVLSILALSTKEMAQSRIKKYLKRLVGLRKTEIQDALQRLDMLTREETGMTVARNLAVTHDVDGNVKTIKELTQDVDDKVKATQDLTQGVDCNVKAVLEVTQDVDGNLKAAKELIQDVDDNVQALDCNVKVVEQVTRSVDDNVKILIEATNEIKQNQSREKLRTWLAPPNPSINHNIARDIQHDGSATWFIQGRSFGEWKMNGSLIWIRGNPGSGKSILCSAIIEDIKRMQNARSALMVYYYFDFKDVAKRDLRGLLSSLLTQLCDDSDRCWDVLSQLYTNCRDGSEQPSEAALRQCLRSMFELPGQVPIYIVLDAVDECPNTSGTPSPREKLLEFLEDLVRSKHSNLYICLTSRPEHDIQTILNPLASGSRRVSLHEEEGQRDDIMSYVRSFVQNDRAMRRWRAEDKELVINALSERADGMFRWVFCQLDTLRRCIPASIRKALNELPITLDETYSRTLGCIPKEKRQHAHRLFQCLIAAIRPLRVEELTEIFAIEFDSNVVPNLVEGWRPEDPEEAVLTACSSLIAIVDVEDSKIVQFSHFSVKEFLTSERLATSNIGNISHYHIPLEPAHSILARACLTVLLQLDDKTDKTRLGTFPLAFYAAQHWVDHAKIGNIASELGDAMECLFDPQKSHLVAWTWIHDVDDQYRPRLRPSMVDLAEHPSPPDATPLYYAAYCGFSALARRLINTHVEDVNAKCGPRGTPLHGACHGGEFECVRLLLESGADVHAQSVSRDVVLHTASMRGQVEVVDLLLQHDADVNAKGDDLTPLIWASLSGHARVAQLLLERGADLNAGDNDGDTALAWASVNGHLDVARLLLSRGADVHTRGLEDRTPFQWATESGHHEIAQLLLEHGAQRE